jgi:hypothetical protein
MPWLPLAILLIAALTIAALALILFPPGEGGAPIDQGDITDGVGGEEMTEGDIADDADDLTPPPAGGDRHPQAGIRLRGEGEEAQAQSGASVAPPPPPGRNLQS